MKNHRYRTMKKIVAVIAAVAIAVVSVPGSFANMIMQASAATVNFDEKNIAMSFAVMTDLHLHQASNSSAEAVQRQVQRYANTVAALNNLAKANNDGAGLDMLMLAGDYCDVGTAVQATAFATATGEILAELEEENQKKPGFIMAYGNHETEAGSTSTINPHMTYEAWEALLNEYGLEATAKDEDGEYVPWGCNHETIEKNGKTYHFLSLEVYSYVSPTNMILNEALEWLDDELEGITTDDPDSYIYFACHGPTQESGLYAANMEQDVNAWWGAAKSGINGLTYATDAQYPVQKATSGNLDDVLKKYPQVMHFSGHYHYSNILESSIMQDNYTSINIAALSQAAPGSSTNNGFYDGLNTSDMAENELYTGYSLLVEVDADGNQRITRVKMDTTYSNSLYAVVTYQEDDPETADLYNEAGTLIERRDERKNTANVEFTDNQPAPVAMTPWILKAPNNKTGAESHLYTYSREARKGTPVFAEDAELKITDLVKKSDDSVELTVTFDTVGAKKADTNYVMRYELEFYNQDGELLDVGKTYNVMTESGAVGSARTKNIWILGNWASSKNGVADGCGTTHLDATKLSYDFTFTAAQLSGTTGIYAKLYAVDEFGGKSEALTFGSKTELLSTAHIVKNGGFEKGDLTNWSDGTTAYPIPEKNEVTITGISAIAVYSGDLEGLAEMYFTTDVNWGTASTKNSGKTITINEGAVSTDITACNGNQLLMATWGAGAMDNGNIVTIPAGLEIQAGDTAYVLAKNFSFKYTRGTESTNGTYEIVDSEDDTKTEPTDPVAVVAASARSGNYSLRFDRKDSSRKFIRTDINSISAETKYKLTYYINTEASSAVEATVYEYSFNNKIVGKHQVEVYGATSGWKKGELTFTTSAGADKLGLILTAKGSAGIVYVDDVTIEAQETEKVSLSYDDSNGDGSFDIRDIVRMKKALKEGKGLLAASKYADRNGDGLFDAADAAALRRKAAGIADDFTNVLVTDGDIEAFGAKLQSDSKMQYMATGGSYTNQTFTFTAEYKKGLRLGVHMPENVPDSFYDQSVTQGLQIVLNEQYAAFYGGNAYNYLKAQSLYSYTFGAQGTLVEGETYLFSVNMTNNGDGTQTLYLEARQDSVMAVQLHCTFSDTECASIPTSGQFVVWAGEPCQEMLYQVVKTENPTTVTTNDQKGQDGVITLKKDTETNLGYLVLDGDYSTEHYRFTTFFDFEKIEYNTILGLSIGINKQDAKNKTEFSNGLTIRLNGGYCTAYVCNNNTNVGHQSAAYTGGTLQPNVEYTFDIQADGKVVTIAIYKGETLHGITTIGNGTSDYSNLSSTATVYDSGAFIVYTNKASQKIAWCMPKEDMSTAEIDADKSAGSAFVAADKTGVLTDSAYIATKNKYTTEAMEFTTVLEKTDHIALGIRMSGKSHNPAAYSGLYIRFTEDGTGYKVYSQGTEITEGTFAKALSAGAKYTFRMSMSGTKLRFDTEQNGTNIHYAVLDVSTAVIPESGYFMVWSMDTYHTVDYSQIIEGGHTKTVSSDGKAGAYVLNGVSTGNSPYLVLDGDYTDETFTFTTVFDEPDFNKFLYVGIHMTANDGYWPDGPGIVVAVKQDSYVIYCANARTYSDHTYGYRTQAVGNYTNKLVVGQEYTFEISYNYDANKLKLIIRQGDTVVNTVNGSLWYYNDGDNGKAEGCKDHIPASGDFMVWSDVEGKKISYEMPIKSGNAVTMSETAGSVKLTEQGSGYSYLAVDGDYRTETFTFKTVINDLDTLDLPVGVRISENKNNWQAGKGMVARITSITLNVYCVDSSHSLGTACYKAWNPAEYLKPGAEHTFEITVVDNDKIHLRITGGIKTLDVNLTHTMGGDTYKKHWTDHMPTSGDFMVWSMVEGQKITYEVKKNE